MNDFICPHCHSDIINCEVEEGSYMTLYYCICQCGYYWTEYVMD